MTDTSVTISGKRGCSDTGITEELATKLYNRARDHKVTELVAIVRFVGDTTTDAVTGSARSLALKIDAIEPVVDGKLNGELVEHVRTIEQALSRNRALAGNKQEALPFDDERDGPAPKVADILQQGKAFFDENEAGEAVIHQPDDEPDPGDQADVDEPEPVEEHEPAPA